MSLTLTAYMKSQDVNELVTVAGASGGVGQLVTAKLLEVLKSPSKLAFRTET